MEGPVKSNFLKREPEYFLKHELERQTLSSVRPARKL